MMTPHQELLLESINNNLTVIAQAAKEYLRRLPPYQYVGMDGKIYTELKMPEPPFEVIF